jgi:hypothetical protein
MKTSTVEKPNRPYAELYLRNDGSFHGRCTWSYEDAVILTMGDMAIELLNDSEAAARAFKEYRNTQTGVPMTFEALQRNDFRDLIVTSESSFDRLHRVNEWVLIEAMKHTGPVSQVYKVCERELSNRAKVGKR